MSNIFLIREMFLGGRCSVRGVSAEGNQWVSAVDFFALAVELVGPDAWPRPVRPPLFMLSSIVKIEPEKLARTFKSFGLRRNDFSSSSAFYLAQECWKTFLTLSGVKDGEADEIIQWMKDSFDDRRSVSHPDETSIAPDAPEDSISEIRALRNRVEDLESSLAARDEQLKRVEDKLSHLIILHRTVKYSPDTGLETSREVKALAGKFYAISKQLEEQGR